MADYVSFRVVGVVAFDDPRQVDLWDDLQRRVEAVVNEPKYRPVRADLAP